MNQGPSSPVVSGVASGVPGMERAAQDLLELLTGLAEIALQEGFKLPQLSELMKQALVDAAEGMAREEQVQGGKLDAEGRPEPLSDSKLSVMTGVHRKDLRRLRRNPDAPGPRKRSLASEVFARWLFAPEFTSQGNPLPLKRSGQGSEPTFEALVASVTQDVHYRGVLDELLRLGQVVIDEHDRIVNVGSAFVPNTDRAEMRRYATLNLSDHLRGVRRNLAKNPKTKFLEQAIFSDEISAESAQSFMQSSRKAWKAMVEEQLPELQRLYDEDLLHKRRMNHRVRLGMYSYAALAPSPPPDELSGDDSAADDSSQSAG